VVSSTGFFHYNVAAPVPGWLPLLWVIASGAFLDVALMLFREAAVQEK
jgi:hypothetical protein